MFIFSDVQIPRINVASGTVFEWRIVAITTGRFSFEVINVEVLQYMSN
jgi:hypothetical protein